jgi:hypothetical protein
MESKRINMADSIADLHLSTEALIQYAYQKLQPKHFDIENYCYTFIFRLAAARACLNDIRATLEHSAILGENETQTRLVKESEASIFHAGGAFEAFGQLLNLTLSLGFPEATAGRKQGVSYAKARQAIISNMPTSPIRDALSSTDTQNFIDELKSVRDQITHRRLLDYRIRIDGAGIWQPYVLTDNQSERPLVPFLERLVLHAEKQAEKCAAALVASV